MTDKEKLEAVLTEIGVPFLTEAPAYMDSEVTHPQTWIEEGEGYPCFICIFNFNKNGKFTYHSVVEE